jgi:hypothetical protein
MVLEFRESTVVCCVSLPLQVRKTIKQFETREHQFYD